MNLIEFKQKKYWNDFVDSKRAIREFKQNQKDIKKYYTIKNSRNKSWNDKRELILIEWRIIF